MVDVEVAPWLRAIPAAPEFYPSEADFADPISYISKIEERARQYGICKIIPPLPKATKKLALRNLNKALEKQGLTPGLARFTTRKQQVGWNSRPGRNQPLAHRLDWQTGMTHSVEEFEMRAKAFARGLLGTCKEVPALSLETTFWKAVEGEPMFVESATDIPGSGFFEPDDKPDRKRIKDKEITPGWKLANSGWSLRQAAQSNGSILKFIKGDIPGITSPVLHVSMLYGWEGWHFEEHELYSLDYVHAGSGKTWYAIPADASGAFEELVRAHGYGGQFDHKEVLAFLRDKETILTPEVLRSAGIPCCRLVQDAGEFVVTFPRAYHFVFSHGFNWAESVSVSTPGWLKIAKEATVRRTNADKQPLFCHEQLLYQSAMAYSQSKPDLVRSSRLKKAVAEEKIKTEFINNISTNHQIIYKLKKSGQAKCILLEDDFNLVYASNILLSFSDESLPSGEIPSPRVNWGSTACAACGVFCFSCIVIVQPSWKPDNEPHPNPCIFCLEHALASQFELEAHGGSRLLVICHPDYYLFERNAEQFAKDLDKEDAVPFLDFDVGNAEDLQTINLAVANGYKLEQGWCIRLQETGSKILKKCDKSSDASDDSDEDSEPKSAKRLKEKKCWVVGKWCGLVWTYDRTNSLLGGCRTSPRLFKDENSDGSNEGLSKEAKESVTDEGEFPIRNFRKRKRSQIWKIHPEQRDKPARGNDEQPKSEELDTPTQEHEVHDDTTTGTCEMEAPRLLQEPDEIPSVFTSEIAFETKVPEAETSEQEQKQVEAEAQSIFENREAENASDIQSMDTGLDINKIPPEEPAAVPFLDINKIPEEPVDENLPGSLDMNEKLEEPAAVPRLKIDINERPEDPAGIYSLEEPETLPQPEISPVKPVNNFLEEKPRDTASKTIEDHPNLKVAEEPNLKVAEDPNLKGEAEAAFPGFQKKFRRTRSARGLTRCRNTIWHDVPISCSRAFYSWIAFIGQSDSTYEGHALQGRGSRAMKEMPRLLEDHPEDRKDILKEEEDEEPEPSEKDVDDASNVSEVSTSTDPDIPTAIPKTRRSQRRKRKIRKAVQETSDDEEYVEPSKDSPVKRPGRNKRVLRSSSKKTKKRRIQYQEVEEEGTEEEEDSETCTESPPRCREPPSNMPSSKEALFRCDVEGCSMSFETKDELGIHKRNICTIRGCAKQLCSHSYLLQHHRVHMDDRPLKCPWNNCRKTFKWAWARTEHIRVHTGARPYTCLDCGKSFRFVSDFSRHKRTTGHSGTG